MLWELDRPPSSRQLNKIQTLSKDHPVDRRTLVKTASSSFPQLRFAGGKNNQITASLAHIHIIFLDYFSIINEISNYRALSVGLIMVARLSW